ncbi:MAG TPA: tetratricopeptide repeat protein, partial [Chloroflexi bacterium]|nr:tetratricopeptide repeat protein [Chloroflexota bacterium]
MFHKSRQNPRILILTILAISLALFVVACGGDEAPAPTPAPTSTQGPPTETPTPAPPTATPTPEPTSTPTVGERIEQGIAYYEQGELDKAIVEYKEAIALEPDNPDAHRNLGTVYVDQGKWEEAVAAYEQAISLNPDFGEAYGDMVAAYINLDKLSEAIDAGEKAIELAPDYATAHNNLGTAYKKQDRLDEAVAEYQEAIRLDPDDALPHYNWGNIHYKQGQVDQAIAKWQEATRLDPNYPNTHKNLGIGYLEREQTAEALAEFEIYLQLAPDASDKAAVEEEIARLNAQLSPSSEEGQDPQSGKDMLITEDEANAFYVGTWKFDADSRNEGDTPSDCRDFLDDSGEEIWYRSFMNCIFDPKPGISLEDIPAANILESAHSDELELLFYGFQPDSDHVAYDMYTLQDERVYFASVTHRNPMLGAGNAPQRSDIDDFLFNVLTTNLSKTGAPAAAGAGVKIYSNKYTGLTLEYPADWVLKEGDSDEAAIVALGTDKDFAAATGPEVYAARPGATIQIAIRDLGQFSATNTSAPLSTSLADLQTEVLKDDYPPLTPIGKITPISFPADLGRGIEGIDGIYKPDLDEGPPLKFRVTTIVQGGRVMVMVGIWAEEYEAQAMPGIKTVFSSANPQLTAAEIFMNVIFLAAQKEDYSFLSELCHPDVDNDGDTQAICDIATATPSSQAEFANYF